MGKSAQDEDGFFGSSYSLETNDETKDHYRQWAATYDDEVGKENGYAQPKRCADALLRHLKPTKNTVVLDCGCGTGLSGVALHRAGYHNIIGCDFSPEMLEIAKDKSVYSDLFQADLNAGLPTIEDASIDVVTAVGVFSFGHVFPDACDHMLRTLKPKGYLIIALNEHYWDEGSLSGKLDSLTNGGSISIIEKEFGEHLPGKDVNGWIIVARKN